MRIKTFLILLPLLCLSITTSCGFLGPVRTIKKAAPGPKGDKRSRVMTAPRKKPRIAGAQGRSVSGLAGVVGLLVIWLLYRVYATARKKARLANANGLRLEDMAMLKIIRDNAAFLWELYRPNRKIIRLDEWRKH